VRSHSSSPLPFSPSNIEATLRVAVSDLVGRPGTSRRLERSLTRDQIGEAPLGPAEDVLTGTVDVDLHLESVIEGILVRGDVGFDVALDCARCLTPVEDHVDVEVAELFHEPDHEDVEEGYEIRDEHVDLGILLRDAIVMSVPVRVLCTDDCQGLCPICGTDRNQGQCGHRPQDDADPRWAKLAQLELPPSTD